MNKDHPYEKWLARQHPQTRKDIRETKAEGNESLYEEQRRKYGYTAAANKRRQLADEIIKEYEERKRLRNMRCLIAEEKQRNKRRAKAEAKRIRKEKRLAALCKAKSDGDIGYNPDVVFADIDPFNTELIECLNHVCDEHDYDIELEQYGFYSVKPYGSKTRTKTDED